MRPILNTARRFLSGKRTTVLILSLAVAVKLIIQISFFTIDGDKSSQLLAAKNLAEGHGLTIGTAVDSNLATVQYIPLTGWPPGYSVVLAPLILLFNHDYKTAALVFDLLAVLPFLFYLWMLLDYLSLQTWLRNLFLLFAGFFFYPFGPSTCTDLVALSCLLAAFYYCLRRMQEEKTTFLQLLLPAFFLFLSGFFKYQYIPVALSFPLLLLIAGKLNQNKNWIRTGLLIFLPLLLLLASLLLFQQYYTGAPAFLNTRETGFFPANLQRMYPVVPASFLDIEIALTVFSKYSGTAYLTNGKILLIAGYLLFFILLFLVARWLYRKKFRLTNPADYFVFLGTGISLVITLLLFYLSARNSSILSPFYQPWTYIQEFRYFLFPVIIIQLSAFFFLFNRFEKLSLTWKRVAWVCAAMIFIQFAHKTYMITRLLVSREPFYHSVYFKKDVRSVTDVFTSVQQQNPGYEIVVVSPDYNFANYAGLENRKALYISHTDNKAQPYRSAEPVKLLLVMDKNVSEFYSERFGYPAGRPFYTLGNLYFYLLDVEPH
ncbi:MAG: hypothetical protein HZA79_03680 [Sphingobacteriales bacterium]|nr:hypothetical protein [Sphingobacteriales bacterium]